MKFYIKYYQRHNNIKTAWIYAKSVMDALKELRKKDTVLEVICCEVR